MAEFDFGSDIPLELPITRHLVESVKAAGATNTGGFVGLNSIGALFTEMLSAIANLERETIAMKANLTEQ